jgi:hypothetical protein
MISNRFLLGAVSLLVLLLCGCGKEPPPDAKLVSADGEVAIFFVAGMTKQLKLY